MYEIKTEDVCSKEMSDFTNNLSKSKYYDDWNKLSIEKMKDEIGDVKIEEFVGLK